MIGTIMGSSFLSKNLLGLQIRNPLDNDLITLETLLTTSTTFNLVLALLQNLYRKKNNQEVSFYN